MYVQRSFSILRSLKHSWGTLPVFGGIAAIPVVLYLYFDMTWMKIPGMPISIMGIALAFYLGFKNNSSYDRLWEARKIWGAIVNSSRSLSIMILDFITNEFANAPVAEKELAEIHKDMIYRHIAWLTALRHGLRKPKTWEHTWRITPEMKKEMGVREFITSLEDDLKAYLSDEEINYHLSKSNPATSIVREQSKKLKELKMKGLIDDFRHMELEKMLVDLYTQQGKSERIKNFPFPRQYASLNFYFITIFTFLLPFGLINELSKMEDQNFIWAAVPLTILIGWIFYMMEVVGDYSENPFEGLMNDVPITSLSRTIEIDMREMINDENIPKPLGPLNDILT